LHLRPFQLRAPNPLLSLILILFLILFLSLSFHADADETAHARQVTGVTVQLEDLTSTEVRDRVAAGSNIILIPIGGTEQTGPYVALGKHNYRSRVLAEQIAQKLGNALVAPVVSYVPEGAVKPPVAHMRYAGTISISDAAFMSVLEGAARSFRQHGFRTIVLLGDHGGYKQDLEQVAGKLNKEWGSDPTTRVIHLAEYYRLSSAGFDAMLKNRGFSDAEIGAHGGLADTSLTMAVGSNLVRSDKLANSTKPLDGVVGDPSRASAELGQAGVQLIVDGSVAAIRAAMK